jgi:Mg2+/Co2+ transporter CorB
MMTLNRYRLRHLARQKNRQALRVQKLLERPDRLLGIVLIGNTFANILASAITTILAFRLYGEYGVFLATIALTLIILIFSEIAPKTVATLYPQRLAFAASMPLSFLQKLLYPMVWLANAIVNNCLKLLRINIEHRSLEPLNIEELRTVVNEASTRVPVIHQDMLLGILDLEKTHVDDIMVPRNEIFGIDLNQEWDDILHLLTTSQYTRLPIYKDDINNTEGILHLRDALYLLAQAKLNPDTLQHIIKPAYFVPEGTPLTTQLLNFRREKIRLALIVDEYGDVLGLIAMEDILEEIVGEYTTDIAEQEPDVVVQPDKTCIVNGSAYIREINRDMGWTLPQDGPKTLSGLITEYLESIPSPGTCIRLAGYPIEILAVEDNLVKLAKVMPTLYSKSYS